MKLSKIFSSGLALGMALMVGTAFSNVSIASAEDEAVAAAPPAAEQQQPPQNTYRYISQKYGYSMKLPQKPLGVVPAAVVFGEEQPGVQGEVLVFENDGYTINKAIVVMVDAFAPEDIPSGILKATDYEKQKVIDNFHKKGLFELVRIAELGNGKVGLFCISAKEIEVDTTGDGVPDEIMEADRQMGMTYFTGEFGGHFMVGVMQNPAVTEMFRYEYELALLSFQQWPTTMPNAQ